MRINIAYLKLTSSVVIGVIFIFGMCAPVRAEPISGLIVEQTPGDTVTPSKWPDAVAGPATDSSDVAGEKNNAMAAQPLQEQLDRERQSIPPPTERNERLLNPLGSQLNESSGSPVVAASVNEGGLLSREIKEAVRPLYEDLAGSAIVETVRDLKSDLGLNGSPSFNNPTSSDHSQKGGNIDPTESEQWDRPGNRYDAHNRPRSAAQIEKDKLVTTVMLNEFIEAIKPWLYSLAGLYIIGYMLKLGLDYSRWKTTRSRKRVSRGRRRHRRPLSVSRADNRSG